MRLTRRIEGGLQFYEGGLRLTRRFEKFARSGDAARSFPQRSFSSDSMAPSVEGGNRQHERGAINVLGEPLRDCTGIVWDTVT